MTDIVFATTNRHKIREVRRILSLPPGIRLCSLLDITGIGDIPEDGKTFAENAEIKARTVVTVTGRPAVADDSGICIRYFNDGPGVYSSRFMSHLGTEGKNRYILDQMSQVPDDERTAWYEAAVVYIDTEGKAHHYRGVVTGRIHHTCDGAGGFGYDPIFYIPEYGRTFADMDDEEKDRLSHRGAAFRAFQRDLTRLSGGEP